MTDAKDPWRKSPAALVAFFDAVLPDDPRVERRKMFGYPCAFVNGNMFTGLHQESLIVRLDEADRARLTGELGARAFEPMPGRPMREYVALPEAILEDENESAGWVRRALDFAAALAPKPRKPPKSRRKAG